MRILHARIAELERERDVTGNFLDSAIEELQKHKRGLSMSNYQELRDAIAAATPGPWHINEDPHWSRQVRRPDDASVAWCGHMAPQALRDAQYIAAANPQTIAALLADLDAARVDAARYQLLSDPDFDDREGVFVRNTREGAGAELDAEITRLKELGVEGGR